MTEVCGPATASARICQPAGRRLMEWLNWRAWIRCRTGPLTSGGRAGRTLRARLAGLLDETERRRWTAYRREEDRERFLAGCALAKTALARYTGQRPADVRFDRTCGQCGEPHGKPVIEGGGVEHSVAHSGDLVAVAVARAPGRRGRRAARRAPAPAGRGRRPGRARAPRALRAPSRPRWPRSPPGRPARAFLVAWTRKEAVTKATGDGLRAAFSEVVVAADAGAAPAGVLALPAVPAERVPARPGRGGPGYVAALAVLGRCAAVRPGTGRRCSRTGPEGGKIGCACEGAVPPADAVL